MSQTVLRGEGTYIEPKPGQVKAKAEAEKRLNTRAHYAKRRDLIAYIRRQYGNMFSIPLPSSVTNNHEYRNIRDHRKTVLRAKLDTPDCPIKGMEPEDWDYALEQAI